MATEATIDIEALLQPFSDDKPAGEDIREDYSPSSVYYQIKDARAAARTAERQIIMSEDPEAMHSMVPEWNTVLDIAPRILLEKGKDLEVTAWYIEALLRVYGFAGLRDGFKLASAMVEKFWDGMYPLPDEDGIETRVAPLTGLNGDDGDGTLIVPITQVSLTEGYTYLPFSAWQYEQAYEVETIADPEKKATRIAAGAVPMKNIQQAVSETSTSFFVTLKEDAEAASKAFAELSKLLDEKCGREAPPTSNIRNALKRILEIIGFLTKDINLAPTEVVEAGTEEAAEVVAGGASNGTVAKGKGVSIDNVNINTRDEAFRALLKVSEFFRSTEPHSPISYNLEQAVKWGRMSLPELLCELIPDNSAREEYFRLTGIPRPE